MFRALGLGGLFAGLGRTLFEGKWNYCYYIVGIFYNGWNERNRKSY